MKNAQEWKQSLVEHKIITDVLPGDLSLSYDLNVIWKNVKLDAPGMEMDREDTQSEPRIHISPSPAATLDNFVLIMTDPDLMMNDDTYFGQVRHWLVSDVSVDSDGFLSLPHGVPISPYVGPAPLPNYLYARPHRYVFILARSNGTTNITSDDLVQLQKPYIAALRGNQEAQDIKDRWGFNAQKLLEMKNLSVEAVTFMYVKGTLRSAAGNMSLMAQGMVNKVRSMI